MKHLIALLFTAIISLNIMTFNVYSENYTTYPYISSSDINRYVADNNEFTAFITKALDSANFYSTHTISGKISLLEPFYLVEYSPLNKKYYQERNKNYSMFSPLVYENKVIALVSFYKNSNEIIPLEIDWISENSETDLNDGICFFKAVDTITSYGTSYGGTDDINIFVMSGNDDVSLSYYKTLRLNADSNTKSEIQNRTALLENVPTFSVLSKYCRVDEKTKVVHSFEYKYSGDKNIASGEKYYLKNKEGNYLSLSDGKLLLTETQQNTFTLTQKESGVFVLSPAAKPKSKLSSDKTTTFYINLSDYDGYCYSICKSDNTDERMYAKGSKAVFVNRESPNVKVSSMDWYIISA